MISEKGGSFHIISRAVDEKKIFVKDEDCHRFVFQVHAANLGKPSFNLQRLNVIQYSKALLNGAKVADDLVIKEHPPLVHILDFALNVTHYHIHVVSAGDSNISLFIKKLNIGFAKYFNLKYHRKGSLFGSRYKRIAIETDFQADAVSRYISVVNPLDIYQPGWRVDGLVNPKKAMKFLEQYQFSSFPDKIGKRQSKILAFGDAVWQYPPDDYLKLTKEFLQETKSFSHLFNIVS